MTMISIIPFIIVGIFIIAAIVLFAATKKDKLPAKSTSYDSKSVHWASSNDCNPKKSNDCSPSDYSGDVGGGDGGGGGGGD
ncbi:hypothetical protein IEO70_03775 [Bacillus sp. AGMB 02131]|uniref:Uncharacterized protein n=1 Tax=Peribacillus faecalis TaxID=2772559 RepID=A0A927CY50_9BACI|nr:hypothetical protein [Peribacillus faecalis]MBD3107474.1 hypothetical protein [Peribacillus faecalis]